MLTGPAAAALAISARSRRTSETHCPIFHEVVRFFDTPPTTALNLRALTGPTALACSSCHAPAGSACVTPAGRRINGVHASRRRTPRVIDTPRRAPQEIPC